MYSDYIVLDTCLFCSKENELKIVYRKLQTYILYNSAQLYAKWLAPSGSRIQLIYSKLDPANYSTLFLQVMFPLDFCLLL